jgi:hypothetical protein
MPGLAQARDQRLADVSRSQNPDFHEFLSLISMLS